MQFNWWKELKQECYGSLKFVHWVTILHYCTNMWQTDRQTCAILWSSVAYIPNVAINLCGSGGWWTSARTTPDWSWQDKNSVWQKSNTRIQLATQSVCISSEHCQWTVMSVNHFRSVLSQKQNNMSLCDFCLVSQFIYVCLYTVYAEQDKWAPPFGRRRLGAAV